MGCAKFAVSNGVDLHIRQTLGDGGCHSHLMAQCCLMGLRTCLADFTDAACWDATMGSRLSRAGLSILYKACQELLLLCAVCTTRTH